MNVMNTTTIKLIAFLGMIAIIGIGIGVIGYHAFNVVEVERIPIAYGIEQGVSGVVVEDQYLNFGVFSPGGGARKNIKLTAPVERRYTITITGDAKGVVFADPPTGLLTPGVTTNVTFTARAPINATEGNYTGEAVVRILRR